MLRYLEKILETDAETTPIALVSVEDTYQRSLKIVAGAKNSTIRLGGKIDRVDRVGSILRVIDYKTGEARQGFSSMDSLFDSSLANRNGAAFQTLFYAWLVAEKHPEEQIMPGLYVMKALYGEKFDPALTMGSYSRRTRIDSFALLEEEFIRLLKEVLVTMFDPGTPFIQTAQEQKCRYCDFAEICNRRFID
jgi:CRISPR/Cas system-associated exonuclease Cas4 (RecB family)